MARQDYGLIFCKENLACQSNKYNTSFSELLTRHGINKSEKFGNLCKMLENYRDNFKIL
jgi:hypothetical protein